MTIRNVEASAEDVQGNEWEVTGDVTLHKAQRATWGYDGGSPPEPAYGEIEGITNVTMRDWKTGQTNDMEEEDIPSDIEDKIYKELEENAMESTEDR